MARYRIRLLALEEDQRGTATDIGRNAGAVLNRAALNRLIMGLDAPPQVIAESDDKAALAELRQELADAGLKAELVDQNAATQRASSAAASVGELVARVQRMPPRARIGIGAAILFMLVAVIGGGMALFGDDETEHASARGGPVGTSSTSSTAVARTSTLTAPPPPPTWFMDLLAELSLPAGCGPETRRFSCVVRQLRTLAESEPAPAPAPAPVDAGVIVDAGEADAGEGVEAPPPPPPKVSNDEYLRALSHKVMRCLADERSTPDKDDEAKVERAIRHLAPVLEYRFGRPRCGATRAAMYDCTEEIREADCAGVAGFVEGALVENSYRVEVIEWAAAFANTMGDKVLSCDREERAAWSGPVERAKVHVYRYGLAEAVEATEDSCTQEDYVDCASQLAELRCPQLGPDFTVNATITVARLRDRCPALAACK